MLHGADRHTTVLGDMPMQKIMSDIPGLAPAIPAAELPHDVVELLTVCLSPDVVAPHRCADGAEGYARARQMLISQVGLHRHVEPRALRQHHLSSTVPSALPLCGVHAGPNGCSRDGSAQPDHVEANSTQRQQ
jgi:hypothetical protein